jgi:hypothetical protein
MWSVCKQLILQPHQATPGDPAVDLFTGSSPALSERRPRRTNGSSRRARGRFGLGRLDRCVLQRVADGQRAGPLTVTGQTNGDSYTFNVSATNRVGTGSTSGALASATPNESTRHTRPCHRRPDAPPYWQSPLRPPFEAGAPHFGRAPTDSQLGHFGVPDCISGPQRSPGPIGSWELLPARGCRGRPALRLLHRHRQSGLPFPRPNRVDAHRAHSGEIGRQEVQLSGSD